ncbi:MAG: hypothetical protein E7Z89_08215 [Cyanobacteria bacterium SIG28]|nr:hypothetical protein [Cyanobacteria bacterium SIG28]
MSKVQKVENNQFKKPLLTPKNTGYAATGAILLATTRAFSKSKPVTKTHKLIGYLAGALTLLHIGVVEYLHHKYKKM